MTGDDRPITFLGVPCPDGFRIRLEALAPGATLEVRPADWADTLVVVERGELELRIRGGACARFREGAVLVLAGLAPRELRSVGDVPLLLSALTRVAPGDESPPAVASHG
jgi:hypothetical protein